jgi:hypothetical protein
VMLSVFSGMEKLLLYFRYPFSLAYTYRAPQADRQ